MKRHLCKKEIFEIFGIGSFSYGLIETVWRGHTHPSMNILGGFTLLTVYCREKFSKKQKHSHIFCAFIITFYEFISGIILNKILKLNVWSYKNRKFNIFGQICALYSFLWFLLSFPIIGLCRLLRRNY